MFSLYKLAAFVCRRKFKKESTLNRPTIKNSNMNRTEFTLSQIRKYGSKSSILTEIPEWVEIGKNCFIDKSVFFSERGFGYEKINNKWVHIPHSGKVIIGDNVSIFSGTNIVRATADDGLTIIGDNSKLDFGIHFAHNVKIGKHCLIIAGSIIGGSTVIGDNCYIGIGAMIKNKLKIGNNVTIGMGSVVICDIPDGETWVGNPAKILTKN